MHHHELYCSRYPNICTGSIYTAMVDCMDSEYTIQQRIQFHRQLIALRSVICGSRAPIPAGTSHNYSARVSHQMSTKTSHDSFYAVMIRPTFISHSTVIRPLYTTIRRPINLLIIIIMPLSP